MCSRHLRRWMGKPEGHSGPGLSPSDDSNMCLRVARNQRSPPGRPHNQDGRALKSHRAPSPIHQLAHTSPISLTLREKRHG